MQQSLDVTHREDRKEPAMHAHARVILMLLSLLWFGLVSAQIPSGDPSPFIEAEIEVDASVEAPGGSADVRGKISINTDGLGGVLDAVIGALCRILPCGGDETQSQILLRTGEPEIGDARTGIVVGSGVVGIGDFFAGIVTEESTFEYGFNIRFASDAAVRIRSMTFGNDAFLTEAYLEYLGVRGAHYVPAGTYFVLDNKLTIPVLQRR